MPGKGAPQIIRTGEPAVDRSLASIAESVRQIDATMDEPKQLVAGVSLTTSPQHVSHGLNRNLVGWRTRRVRGFAMIKDQQDTNPTPDRTLILVASAAVSIDIDVW